MVQQWSCPRCSKLMPNIATHACGALTASSRANASKPHSQRSKLLSAYNGTSKKLTGAHPSIYPGFLRKYDVALQNWGNDIGARAATSSWKLYSDKFTLDDLSQLGPAGHAQLIDNIWEEIIEFRPYATPIAGMRDLNTPNHRSSLTRSGEAMFSQHGYGFRCDGRKPDNVSQYGFLPEYAFNCPDYARDTILQGSATGGDGYTKAAGFWIGNRDIVNQTSICVARELKACGKFPTPKDVGTHFLYAFRFALQKKGFDTEARQLQTGGRWLGGEKCFPQIVPNEIIAHTEITKLGSDTGTDAFNTFSYKITMPVWNYSVHATTADKAYLDAELKALTGGKPLVTITIAKGEDFVAE